MWSRLKLVYDTINKYLADSHAKIANFRDDLRDMAVIEFQHGNEVCRIYMDQEQDYVVLGDLKDNRPIAGNDISDDLFVMGWGPTGRENGLCRVRITIGDQRDIFYRKTDATAKHVSSEKLSKFDYALADEAINFLRGFLRGR